MNKQCFRVIFNKTLQCFVVVSELAKVEGKSAEGKEKFTLSRYPYFVALRPLTFSLFCALGLVSLPTLAQAETLIIRADESAPKNQQPIILQTANGIPQVNIQTPNDKGLSHNKYSKFDVDTKGAILNNSRKNVQTQQAGWVQGNPYLAKGEAKVILNEVNSNDPSLLKGYVEVAGQKADVIIANPSGIHCSGCGVINSDRATFSTGKPQIQNGNLEGFVVEKGKVQVDGKGLDNSRVDYTEILSREVKANAGIWSKKEVDVVTGKNKVKRLTPESSNGNGASTQAGALQIIHTEQTDSNETAPQFAVDVSELGGMYAGKIHLIGTEKGLGVRNAGHIGASSDSLQIDSQGRIINTGTLNAAQALSLTSTQDIENQNTGKIENHQGDIRLNSKSTIQQQGSVVARQGDVHKQAEKGITQQGETLAQGNIHYSAPTIEATRSSLIAAGVNVQDSAQGETRQLEEKSSQGKTLSLISTGKTTIQGKYVASGKVDILASGIDGNHSQLSAHSASLMAKSGEAQLNQVLWSVDDALSVQTPLALSTVGSELSAGQWKVLALAVNNQSGRWFGKSATPLQLDLQGGLNNVAGVIQNQGDIRLQGHNVGTDNTQGMIKSLQGDIHLTSRTLFQNNQGKVVALGSLTLEHSGLNNQQGYLLAQQGKADLQLHEKALNNQQGNILAGQDLRIFSGKLTNLQGTIYSGRNLQIDTHSTALDNQQQGKILATQDIHINAQELLNDTGIIEAVNNATLSVEQRILNNKTSPEGSKIQAEKQLSITTKSLENQGTKATNERPESGIITSTLAISATDLNNQAGGIYSLKDNQINLLAKLNNQQGEIRSLGNLTITGQALSIENQQGELSALADLTISANRLTSLGVISGENTSLSLVEGFNSQTDIKGKNSLKITTQGDFINQANLHSEGVLSLSAKGIQNLASGKIKAQDIHLTAHQHTINRGLINGLGKTIIKSGDNLENIGTGRIYGNYIALQATTLMNQDERVDAEIKSAVIASRGELHIGAKNIYNQQLHLIPSANEKAGVTFSSDGDMHIGGVLDGNNQAQGNAKLLHNTSALIEVGKNLRLGVEETINSNKYIYSVIEEKSRTPVNESYLISGNTLRDGERINFDLLKWVGFSRAGKVVFKHVAQKPADPNDLSTQILPLPNEVVCQDQKTQTGCSPMPKSVYLPTDPVWAFFNITPPTDAPVLPDLSQLDPELDAPSKPVEPKKKRFKESEAAYQARLKQYESDKNAYDAAVKAYEAEKAKYETEIKPYLDWAEKNQGAFDKLEEAISKHNRRLQGREFKRFWVNTVRERVVKQDEVKDSVPAQILVGEDLSFSGNLTNNQSTILAGSKISNSQSSNTTVKNNDLWGVHIIEDHGTEQWTKSRWRGGFKRYHQRDWGSKNAYIHETRTDIPLNVVKMEENSDYQKVQQNLPVAIGSVALKDGAIENRTNQAPIFAHTGEIRSVRADVRLPTSSLYRIQLDPNHRILIETDPEFINKRSWLSSDYMFNALRHDHENVHKRLGDGYYEQRLVREQINMLTGKMFTDEHKDFESQYKALMDSGITFAQKFNLRPGIALSAAQVAQLTSDIVWFEPTVVKLADGSEQTVLSPRVYVVARKEDVEGNGALIAGKQVDLQNLSELENSGTIYGRQLTRLNGEKIENLGKITGALTTLSSTKLVNLGGIIEGEKAVVVQGKAIDLRSTTQTSGVTLSQFSRSQTNLSRQALIHTKNADGVLVLIGENLNMTGAKVQNDGNGVTDIHFTGDIRLNALKVGFEEKLGRGNHYRNQASEDVVVSHIQGNGQVQLRGQNIYAQGADLDAKGKLIALAENDVVLESARRQTHYEEFHKTKSGSALSRKTSTSLDQENEQSHKGSELTGEAVLVNAGRNIIGETVLAVAKTGDVEFIANNNVELNSATNQLSEKHIRETKRSGFLNGGELGFTIGSQKIRQESTLDGAIQSNARNTLASEQGNVRVQSGHQASVSNIDVFVANDKKAIISGKAGVKVVAGKDIIQTTDKYEFSQSGLSIALSTPVTDAIQSARQSMQQAKATKNDKLKGVYAIKAAEDAVIAAQNAQKVADTLGKLGQNMEQNSAAAENPAVKISISIGTQKQKQESETQKITHIKSQLQGGNVEIASGEGEVELWGVDTKVKDNLLLNAKTGIISRGVMDSISNKTQNKSHSASVGVFVGFNGNSYGIGIEGSASVGRGKENGEIQAWQNNQLQAGKVQINTEDKLTLEASQLKANRLEVNASALDIISRQDVSKYNSKQVQAGGGFSVTYGSGGGASFNASYSSAKLNAAQVEHQSGIEVGQGGMNINVQGNTHLEGAIIASQADSQHNRFDTGALSTKDIENYSELKTRNASISGGTGGINPMSALSLLGNKNESEHTTTKSAIGSNINIQLTQDPNAESTLQSLNRDTKNANQKVSKHNLQEIKETQELVKGIGEIADKAMQIYTHNEREKIEQAKLELGRAKAQNASEEEITQLNNKLNDLQKVYDKEYGTGSPTKRAVDAITAALQGLAAKDGRQALVGLASPYVNEQIKKYTGDNKQANLIAHALLGAVEAQITGNNALAGAVAGAGSEGAAMVIKNTLYSDKPIDQLSESEKQTITFLSQLAGGLAAGVVGDSAQSAAIGADIGKRAVENNFFDVVVNNPQVDWLGMAEGERVKQVVDEEIAEETKDIVDKYAPHYISASAQLYGMGLKTSVNLRNADVVVGGVFSPVVLPNRFGVSASVNLGWITNLERSDIRGNDNKRITDKTISKAIEGDAWGVSGCYKLGCIGYGQTFPSKPNDKAFNNLELGVGFGGTGGSINQERTYKIGNSEGSN